MKQLVTLFLALFTFTAYSQDYYWVDGSGNWSDFATHWATTSGGSTFHTSAPTSTNDVYFDASSFSSTSQVATLDVVADCQSMDWTGVLHFPSIDGNGNDMNIYGSLTLAADMTADFTNVEFEATTTGHTITANGTDLGLSSNTRFNGIGGEWTFQDNFTTDKLFITAGTLNTNNNNINSGSFFQSSGSAAKVFNLGSSVITSTRWWMLGTNQTINAGTSKIIVSSFYADDAGDGPFTYHNVEFNNYGRLYNTSTFNEITVPAGLDLQLQSGDVFTVNNIVADGSKHNTIEIYATTSGSEATINKASGSIAISYTELQDIHAGGGATFTANNTVDNGNNIGWTINALTGLDYYWVGDGGNWTDFANHWATTSGGATMHTDYPNKLDDVYFDANSFTSGGETVTNDLDDGAFFHNMDWTGATNTPNLNAAFSFQLEAYGSITFIPGMTHSIHTLSFNGDETGLTFTSHETNSISFLYFEGDGEYDLLSDVKVSTFRHWHGTVNYNSVNIDCSGDFDIGNGAGTPIINLGSSTISCRDFNVHPTTTPTVNIGTSTVTISRDFDGSGQPMNDVTLDGTGGFFGSSTFEHLTVTAGSSATFEAGETLTINQSITMDGTKANPINLSSDETGIQSTISMGSGTANLTFLVLQDLAAAGGATFNATQTVDNGNNSGWTITPLTGSDYYWVGGSGNWSDFANHWATTSGGSTFETTAPGILDNIIFDASSFSSADEIVTIDSDEVNCNDLDASTSTMDFTISGSGKELNVYGSINLPATASGEVSTYNFLSVNSETLNFNDGPGSSYDLNFVASGTWTLSSSLNAGELTIESGTVNTSGHDLTLDNSLTFLSSNTKTLNLGSSAMITSSINANTAENVNFNGSSSDISLERTLLLTQSPSNTISMNNLTYVSNSFSNAALLYDDLVLNNFTVEAGVTLKPVGHLTITTSNLSAVGTAVDPIIFEPQTASSSLTISQASGTVDAHYLEMEEVTAEGGATFNAFSSIDNGGVIGWIFHKLGQTIDFPALADKALADPDFDLTATATSGLPVSFEILSGPAIISGTTLSITGGGIVQVKAAQTGDITYDPAPSVINSFEVQKTDQTIVFDAIPAQLLSNGTLELTATGGGSIAPVTFASSNLSVATIVGSNVTFVSEGNTTITASQLGDENYEDATPVDQDLVISAGNLSQMITFSGVASKTYGDVAFDLTATASSGLDVTYLSSDESVVTIVGSLATIVGAGVSTVTATQAGDDVYNAAANVNQDFVANETSLTATAEDQERMYGDANPTLTVSYSGFVNGDDESDLSTVPTVNTAAIAASDVGDYAITVQGGSSGNYLLTREEGNLVVTKREITATADDVSIREGDAIPTLTLSYSELVNGDEAVDIDIAPAISTTAGATSAIGVYPITLAGGEDSNYLLELVDGTLTIDIALGSGDFLGGLRFYPNPTKDFLFIDQVQGQLELEIWTLGGKLLENHEINSAYTFDLRSKKKGTYLLVFKSDGEHLETSRLIVE